MNAFILPKAHSLRATWVPLYFYPLLGSADCITIAVVAIDTNGKCKVHKSDRLSRLSCLFDSHEAEIVKFINLNVSAVEREVSKRGKAIFENPIELGSSFAFGPPTAGSGFSLDEIAASWLSKISVLQFQPTASIPYRQSVVQSRDEPLAAESAVRRERKIIPAVREELKAIAPKFVANFEKEFIFKDRRVPVKLDYSGKNLVADFDRVSPKNIESSLERVRSKLWVLAEHRDQTRHEMPRLHEMLVVPTTIQGAIVDQKSMRQVNEACDDIENEADRRDIRLRRFTSTKELAAHIFRVESSGQPTAFH